MPQVLVYLSTDGKYAITDNPFIDAIETWHIDVGNRWAKYGPFTMTVEERGYHFCEHKTCSVQRRTPQCQLDIEREKIERALCCALGVEYRR